MLKRLYKNPLICGIFFFLLSVVCVTGVLDSFAHVSSVSAASTSNSLNFQARLLNSAGGVVPDGNYNIDFKLYNTSSPTNQGVGTCSGSCLWEESYVYSGYSGAHAPNPGAQLQVRDGYFSVYLGANNPFPATINWEQPLYLTMNIGGTTSSGAITWDGEMTSGGNGIQLTALPYAFIANQLANDDTNGNRAKLGFGAFPAVTNQTFNITLPLESGNNNPVICYQNDTNCGFAASAGSTNYIQDCSRTAPSTCATAQAANFDISGNTAIAKATAQISDAGNGALVITGGSDSKATESIIVGTGDALDVGNGTTNTLSITSAGLLQGTAGATLTGAINLNASGSVQTNVATGTGALGIGNTTGVTTLLGGNGSTVSLGSYFGVNNAGDVQLEPTTQSTTAFNVINEATAASLFAVDTLDGTDGKVKINNPTDTITQVVDGANTYNVTLDASGDINTDSGFSINGKIICDANGCSASPGSNGYIVNSYSSTQSANFNIKGTVANAPAAVIIANGNANSILPTTGDILDLYGTTSTSTTPVVSFSSAGAALLQNQSNSQVAFSVEDAVGSSPNNDVINVDTTNNCVGIDFTRTNDTTAGASCADQTSGGPTWALDVNGNINATSNIYVAGAKVCTVGSGCTATSTSCSPACVLSEAAQQTSTEFWIQATAGDSAGIVEAGNTSTTIPTFQVDNSAGTPVDSFYSNGANLIQPVTLGTTSSAPGTLILNNGTGTGAVTITNNTLSNNSYSLSLPTTGPQAGLCLETAPTNKNQLVFSTCANPNPSISEVQETDATGTITTTDSGNVPLTFTPGPAQATPVGGLGDEVVLTSDIGANAGFSISSIAGGGVTNWKQVTASAGTVSNTNNVEVWAGTVSTTTATTNACSTTTATLNICVTYAGSGSLSANNAVNLTATEFTAAGVNVNTTWGVDTSGGQNNGTTAAASVAFNTLTSDGAAELYYGYAYVQNNSFTGSTDGTFNYIKTAAGNEIAYATPTVLGQSYSPSSITQSPNGYSNVVDFLVTAFVNSISINNSTSVQKANFNVQAAYTGSVAGILEGNASGTADIFDALNGSGTKVATIGYNGDVTFQNSTDSTSAFILKQAGGASVILGDTLHDIVEIAGATYASSNSYKDLQGNTIALDVNGDINAKSLSVNGSELCTSNCSPGAGSSNYIQNCAATGSTCTTSTSQTAYFNITNPNISSITDGGAGALQILGSSSDTTASTLQVNAGASQTDNLVSVKNGATTLVQLGVTGALALQNSANSTNAFQINNFGGSSVLNANTTNSIIEIAAATYASTHSYLDLSSHAIALDVNGDINATSLSVNGSELCTSNCSPGSGSSNYIQNCAATGSTCTTTSPQSGYFNLTNANTSAITDGGLGALLLTGSSSDTTASTLQINAGTSQTDNLIALKSGSNSLLTVGVNGLVTLAGGLAPDITTAAGSTATSIGIQPGSSDLASGTGAALNLSGGNQTGTTSTGGSVNVDAGTGTTTNGSVNIGTTNASTTTLGRSGGTTTINGGSSSAITFTNFTVSGAGAVVGVGVNSGAGLLQGTGGLTVTGAVNLNATGTSAVAINIGNSSTYTGTIALGNSGSTTTIAGNGTSSITFPTFTVASGGATTLKNTANSTTAFLVESSGSTSILNVNTVNSLVQIAGASYANSSNSYEDTSAHAIGLDVAGDINANYFSVNGSELCTSNCTPGGGSSNYVQNCAATGSTCTTSTPQSGYFNLTNAELSTLSDGGTGALLLNGSSADTTVATLQIAAGTSQTDNLVTVNNGTNNLLTLGTGSANVATGAGDSLTLGNSTGATTLDGNASSAITFTNFTVSGAGAVVGVGVNSGAGLLQGTGGLTVTGAVNLNATGTSAVAINIGNSSTYTGTIALGNSGSTTTIAGNGTSSITFPTFTVASGGATTLKNTANSTTAFLVETSASGSILNVDTTDAIVEIAGATYASTHSYVDTSSHAIGLDVAGDINANSLSISGTEICNSGGCTSSSGSGNYIQNCAANSGTCTSAQSANLDIASALSTEPAAQITGAGGGALLLTGAASSSSVVATIKGGASQTGDILDIATSSSTFAAFNSAGTILLGGVTTSSAGSCSSANLSGNGVCIGANGLTLSGTALALRSIDLPAEYAGGVLDNSQLTNTIGTMTSGITNSSMASCSTAASAPTHNFYNWTTAQSTAQSYDIVVEVPIPTNFAAWYNGGGAGALSLSYCDDTTSGNSVAIITTNEAGAASTATTLANTSGAWSNTNSVALLSGDSTDTASTSTTPKYITVRIRVTAGTNGQVYVGGLHLLYYSNN